MRAQWREILSRVAATNPGAYAILRETLPDHIEGNQLMLDFPPSMSVFMPSVLNPAQYKTMIENHVNGVLHAALRLNGFIGAEREPCADDADEAEPAQQQAQPPAPEPEQEKLF